MRDLHDTHARDMMLDLTGERRDVPPMGRAPEASGPAYGAGQRQTHAWAAEGRQRPPEGLGGPSSSLVEIPEAGLIASADIVAEAYAAWVGAMFDAAAEAAHGMAFWSKVPWVEGDEDYARRLGYTDLEALDRIRQTLGGSLRKALYLIGQGSSLPRARLVPAEG